MLDDRESTEGDIVHQNNELEWRQKFSEDTGHEMECIEETVADMAQLIAKTCSAFGNLPPDEVTAKLDVEVFDKHIRAILNSKDCDCLK